MTNEKKLDLTLFTMLKYQLEYECKNETMYWGYPYLKRLGFRFVVDLFDTPKHLFLRSVSDDWNWIKQLNYNAKPRLHSMENIIKPILKDGLIPIIELAKMFHKSKEYKVTHYNNITSDEKRYSVNCCVENDNSRYMYFQINTDVLNESAKIVEQLKEWHFNIYDLPKEMYIEKSEAL